jgi:hypothetical protein
MGSDVLLSSDQVSVQIRSEGTFNAMAMADCYRKAKHGFTLGSGKR